MRAPAKARSVDRESLAEALGRKVERKARYQAGKVAITRWQKTRVLKRLSIKAKLFGGKSVVRRWVAEVGGMKSRLPYHFFSLFLSFIPQ